MRRLLPLMFVASAVMATPALAALSVGAKAPDFQTTGAIAGEYCLPAMLSP